MYATCIFCNQALGRNEVLEDFPVGHRLAFDTARGRLWVICRKCERWNLSPLEERWEAIEAAERIYRELRMRVATENIGLARHPAGLELVRIGRPLRPEFAAWRYGDQFGRRRRRAILLGAGSLAVLGLIATAGIATGVITTGVLGQSGNFVNMWLNGRVMLKLPTDQGVLKCKRQDLLQSKLSLDDDGEWSFSVGKGRKKERVFRGSEAERVAGLVLPKVNSTGARPVNVQRAVSDIERAGGPEAYLSLIVSSPMAQTRRAARPERAGRLGYLPTPTRLALEMALHEEQERRALQGELKVLELAWKAAEEVAAIADDLLLPEGIREKVAEEAASLGRAPGGQEAV
jgi:hypothetical protein